MPTKTDELEGQIRAVLLEAKSIAEAAENDGDRDFTADERAQITAKMTEAKSLKGKLDEARGDAATRKAITDLGDGIGLNEPRQRQTPSGLIVPEGGKSLGELYTSAPEYKAMLSSAPSGNFGEKQRVQSNPTGFKSLVGGQKTLVTGASATQGGPFINPDHRGLQVGLDLFERPLVLRDLVTNGTTTSDSLDYVQVVSTTNNAAPVPEATSSALPTAPGTAGALVQNAGGGYKPESGLTTVRKTANVKTIAHWIPITKRALSDAAQMRTLIDNFLMYGLEEELEDQMIAGDGTGENFTGLANTSGLQTQAFSTDILTTTRKAKTKILVVGRSRPTGWVFNPADAETLDLLKDTTGRFYGDGPFGTTGGLTETLWRTPVIQSEAVPAGYAYLGDWRKAVLWDREQASITTTDSHADFFVRNIVAILAEMRAAFAFLQPSAFVKVALA